MPLIKCPDCGTDVSDRAVACPKCAAPLQGISPDRPSAHPSPAAADSAPVVIEQTRKQWKGLQLVSVVLVCLGAITCVAQAPTATAIFWVVGMVLYVASRLGAWWQNG
jgi:hypothetical protein